MTIRVFFRWAAWLLVLVIAVFTLSPIGLRPTIGTSALSAELERLAAFAFVGASFSIGYPKHRLAVFLLVSGMVGGLELAQNLVPDRHGHFSDGMVKAAGALLGIAVAVLIERWMSIRFRIVQK